MPCTLLSFHVSTPVCKVYSLLRNPHSSYTTLILEEEGWSGKTVNFRLDGAPAGGISPTRCSSRQETSPPHRVQGEFPGPLMNTNVTLINHQLINYIIPR